MSTVAAAALTLSRRKNALQRNYNSPCDRTSQEFNDFGKLFLKQTFLDQNRILLFYRVILILNRTRSALQNHGFITTH